MDTNGTLMTGLQAYYQLENSSDSHTNSYNLAGQGSITYTPSGIINNGAYQGSNNSTKYLVTANKLGIDGSSSSFSFWIRPSSSPASGDDYFIFWQEGHTNHVSYQLNYVNVGGTYKLNMTRGRDGIVGNSASSSYTLPTNTSTHVVARYDGSILQLFANNVSLGTTTASGSGSVDNQGEGFAIGGVTSGIKPSSAMIDEFGVWSKSLSDQEIVDLYNGGAGNAFSATPSSFYAQIKNTSAGVLTMRQASSASAVAIKELPEDWVVYVASTTDVGGNAWISGSSPSYRWFKVIDKTDNTEGWMAASSSDGTVYLSYVTSTSQSTFEGMASSTLSASSTRAEKIVEAVNWYWSHVNSTDSLYNTGFPSLFSSTSTWEFPKELFYGILSQESGGGSNSFNNEIVTFDYGHGITQLTAKPTSSDIYFLQVLLNKDALTQVATSGPGSAGNETHEFGALTEDAVKRFQQQHSVSPINGVVGYDTRAELNLLLPTSTIPSNFRFEEFQSTSTNNKDTTSSLAIFDNRGLGNGISIPPCENLQDRSSINYIRKCYKGISGSTQKEYEPHPDFGNQIFKYYTNTSQSIYANLKGGLTDLYNKYDFSPGTSTASSTLFQPYEREWLRTTWRYNGSPSQVGYLTAVASQMDSFSNYISSTGTKMVATSSVSVDLANKLRIADANKTEVVVFSPVELSVADSVGRISGIVDGVVKEGIPDSAYNPRREAVAVFFGNEDYTYNIKGIGEGTYGLLIEHPRLGLRLRVYAPAIPVKAGEKHSYTVDWDAIARDEQGVHVKIDSDGNDIIDKELALDSNFSGFALFDGLLPLSQKEQLPEEDTQISCSDDKDNDRDGAIDLSDFDCRFFIPPPVNFFLQQATSTIEQI